MPARSAERQGPSRLRPYPGSEIDEGSSLEVAARRLQGLGPELANRLEHPVADRSFSSRADSS
jgi:hypothetical protein